MTCLFRKNCWKSIVCGALLCLLAPLAAEAKESSEENIALVARVAARIFEVAPSVEGWAWPPLVGIGDVEGKPGINAFATVRLLTPPQRPVLNWHGADLKVHWIDVPYSATPTGNGVEAGGQKAAQTGGQSARTQPIICVLQGLLDAISQLPAGKHEPYLAETFAHELGHILLRHVTTSQPGAPLVRFVGTRQQESDADVMGVKLALRADYPYDELINSMKMMRDIYPAGGKVEELARTHPSDTERLAVVDERQSELWSTLSEFETGVYFLTAENYPLAERCFTQVVKEMPRCYEAWADRGYARLMRYCDNLEPDDVKELGLNQIVVGGFYRRAGSIEPRGVNMELWFDAVGDLKEALRLKETLILPRANLALAYLVHPNGKQPDKAAELYEQVFAALKQGSPDEKIGPAEQAVLLVNAGVTQYAGGHPQAARRFFDEALAAYKQLKTAPTGPVQSAMLYSEASQMASSAQESDRKQAVERFTQYLRTTHPGVAWWNLAYERYKQLCTAEKLQARSPQELFRPATLRFRPVLNVDVGGGKEIALNEPVSAVTEEFGEGTKVPIIRRTNVHRRKYPERGLELVCSDRVLAIRLRDPKAPLTLKASGPGGSTAEVRVGMSFEDLEKRLGRDATAWDRRSGAFQSLNYHYFYGLGFGVLLDEDDKVTEIIVAQIPYEERA